MAEKYILIQHNYYDMEVNCDEEYAEFCYNEHYKLVGIVETEEQAKKLCDEWNHSAKSGLRFDEDDSDEEELDEEGFDGDDFDEEELDEEGFDGDDFDEEELDEEGFDGDDFDDECIELMYQKVQMLGSEFVFEPEIL